MRRLWLAPVLALTLTACGAEPLDERRADVEAVLLAANAGDAAGLRAAVEDLRSTLRAQVASNELDRAEAERLNAIALRLLENADLLEQPSPSPSPVEQETEEPSPEPEPSPEEESEEPSPEPEETEEAEPSPEVEESPPSEIELPPVEESPPSAHSQTAPSSEPTPA